MKHLIMLTFAFLSSLACLQAQYSEVVYDEIIKASNSTRNSEYYLQIDSKASQYYRTKTQTQRTNSENLEERNKNVTPFVSKNFSDKKIIYNQASLNKVFTIAEVMPLQKWKMDTETKKIGNYLCKKATTLFRGRAYTAWYTESLPFIGGPWKFDGLPGMILEVASNDGFLSIKARTVTLKSGGMPAAPFSINTSDEINWEGYCNQTLALIKRWEKVIAAKGDPGDEFKLNFEMIEEIGIKEVTVSK